MKALTRETIIDAADRLFIERGYAKVSLDDVAAEAGVSLRTLYRYFEIDTKESIALAREADLFERFERGLHDRTGDVVTYWRSFLETGVEELEERGEDWLRKHVELIRANPSLDARNRMINARYERLLAAELTEETGNDDLGAYLFAAALIAGQTAVVERWLASGEPFDPGLFRRAVDYLIEAFRPKLAKDRRGRMRALAR